MMKYYKVEAKCGHVGKSKYILKWFYIKAEDGCQASKIVREKPRVKHHHKDAIREVIEITYDEYYAGCKLSSLDMYFHSHCRQEQITCNCVDINDILYEKEDITFKRDYHKQWMLSNQLDKEWTKEKQRGISYYG